MMKKLFITILGALLVILGAIFIIIPGPSLLLLIPGFYLLSTEYEWAKVWLKKCQHLLSSMAKYADTLVLKRKLSK